MAQPWDLPEREATPEKHLLSRRRWLFSVGLGGLAAVGGGSAYWWYLGGSDEEVLGSGRERMPGIQVQDDRDKAFYPATKNPEFAEVDRPLTIEASAARYCNFYEFSGAKNVWRYVEPFQARPWTLEITGLVAKPMKLDFDDLLKKLPLEERLYRHRCVEAWAMAVPWTGFPLSSLLKMVEPLAEARYVKFSTFDLPNQASRQRVKSYPWPYTEGLTLAEATNPLAFIATGMYGHGLLKQHGAPVRLVLPWKYGFKSAKSLVRIELTRDQPATFWNTLMPHEYDFTANVDPNIPHPRWSQANERMLGTDEIRPTQIYNGYGEWVAKLYS